MKKGKILSVCMLLLVGLTGCNSKETTQLVEIEIKPYERVVYETEEVKKGDIVPTIELVLEVNNFERIGYSVGEILEVENLYVTKGDFVSVGDVMAMFKSGDLEEQMDTYQKQAEEAQLLLEHYKQLQNIEPETDYTDDIKSIEEEIRVALLYVSEFKEKLNAYSLVAEKSGTVTLVSEMLNHGEVIPGENLITVTSGEGYYAMADLDYEYNIGDIYTVDYGVASYELEIIDIEKEEEEEETDETAAGAENPAKLKLIFEPKSDMSNISETSSLKIVIERPTLSNVKYVPEKALREGVDGQYVYLVSEDGFREIAYVKCEEIVDGNAIITGEIEEGDRVYVE